jgi:hypothetical protein
MNITTPDMNITTPDMNITTPDMNITTPDMNITTPDMNIMTPDMNIMTPDMNIMTPDMNIMKTDMNIMTPDMNIMKTDMNIMTPDMNIMMPDMNIMKPDMNIMTPDISQSMVKPSWCYTLWHHAAWCRSTTLLGEQAVPQLLMTSCTKFRVPIFIDPDMATPPSCMRCTSNNFYVAHTDRQRMKDCSNTKQWSNCHIVHDTDRKTQCYGCVRQ